jgi:hypothetical protein
LYDAAGAKEADALPNLKILNRIMLGALFSVRPPLKPDSLLAALKEILPERYRHLLPLNERALRRRMRLTNTAPGHRAGLPVEDADSSLREAEGSKKT